MIVPVILPRPHNTLAYTEPNHPILLFISVITPLVLTVLFLGLAMILNSFGKEKIADLCMNTVLGFMGLDILGILVWIIAEIISYCM